jgi:hypothetical protein
MKNLLTVLFVGLALLIAPAGTMGQDDGSTPKGLRPEAMRAGEDIFGKLIARYLVTFIKSRTTDPIRTATVVSITNQTRKTCQVAVDWFQGFNPAPVCATAFSLDAGFTTDFCSREIPDPLTTCNATCAPELTFDEGKAVVNASCEDIGVSARVYYTRGDDDNELSAISDSKIVRFGEGNRGD